MFKVLAHFQPNLLQGSQRACCDQAIDGFRASIMFVVHLFHTHGVSTIQKCFEVWPVARYTFCFRFVFRRGVLVEIAMRVDVLPIWIDGVI